MALDRPLSDFERILLLELSPEFFLPQAEVLKAMRTDSSTLIYTLKQLQQHGLVECAKLRPRGPGVSDLICFVPDHRGLTLPTGKPKLFEHAYVEMKALDGVQSEPQADFEAMCVAAGVSYRLCYGLNGFYALCLELDSAMDVSASHGTVSKWPTNATKRPDRRMRRHLVRLNRIYIKEFVIPALADSFSSSTDKVEISIVSDQTLAEFLGTTDTGLAPAEPVDYAALSGQEFAQKVLASPEFRRYIVNSLTLGSIPPAILGKLMDHGWGKPPEKVEFEDKTKALEALTRDELTQRMAALAAVLGAQS